MVKDLIPNYPETAELCFEMRPILDSYLRKIGSQQPDAVHNLSEYSFGTLYLFRKKYKYRAAWIAGECLLVIGDDKGQHGGSAISRLAVGGLATSRPVISGKFFMLIGKLPRKEVLDELFLRYNSMKSVAEAQAKELEEQGYLVKEDRDNFDYLYLREELATYPAGKYRKKRALVRAFTESNSHETYPLTKERAGDALVVLEAWQQGQAGQKNADGETATSAGSPAQYATRQGRVIDEQAGINDYLSAKEALVLIDELALTGMVVYVGEKPVAYCLGEELVGESFVIHYEKGVYGYKGLKQFVVQAFAKSLSEHYKYINREQDLGLPGLREAKMGLRPAKFAMQYRVVKG